MIYWKHADGGLCAQAFLLVTLLVPFVAGCSEATDVAPWDGTLGSGVRAMADQSAAGDVDGALATADRMLAPGGAAQLRQTLDRATRGVSESVLSPVTRVLDLLGVSALSGEDRAEIEYARASALLVGASKGEENAPGLIERAEAALQRARAAAPGEARMSAIYNLGTLDLMAAEAVRATIPEIAGPDAAAAAGPASPPDPNQADEPEEDPLVIARALYLKARADFVELLAQEPSEPQPGQNGAANVEFVIRRLKELDAIEKQREEQQQDQQDDGEKSEDGEKSDEQQSKDDQKQQEDDSEKSEDGETSDEQKPSEEENPDESPSEEEKSKEDPAEDSEEQEPEETPEDSQDESEESIDQPPPGEETIEEKTMTAEEFQRLLERNSKLQEQGEEIRRLRRMRGKIPAKKDW
ncbi:hypothetical protein [Planctomycetes bacterium Poly30]